MMPFQRQLRRIKHAWVPFEEPKGVDDMTVEDALRLVSYVHSAGHTLRGAAVLEIGTGWQPIVPLMFRLAGADVVWTVDAERLMTAATFQRALRVIIRRAAHVAAGLNLTAAEVESRLRVEPGLPLAELEERFCLRYLAPADARRLPLGDRSIDVIASRAVLEHISPALIEGIFRECRRAMKVDGLACHIIDNSDHFAHRDHRVSFVNFLKFSDRTWRFLTLSPHNYQNRLRHQQYARLLTASGLRILREDHKIDARALSVLPVMRIAAPFVGMPPEELACIESCFVAAPDFIGISLN
jgi:SAM-dependent methyltransferase